MSKITRDEYVEKFLHRKKIPQSHGNLYTIKGKNVNILLSKHEDWGRKSIKVVALQFEKTSLLSGDENYHGYNIPKQPDIISLNTKFPEQVVMIDKGDILEGYETEIEELTSLIKVQDVSIVVFSKGIFESLDLPNYKIVILNKPVESARDWIRNCLYKSNYIFEPANVKFPVLSEKEKRMLNYAPTLESEDDFYKDDKSLIRNLRSQAENIQLIQRRFTTHLYINNSLSSEWPYKFRDKADSYVGQNIEGPWYKIHETNTWRN